MNSVSQRPFYFVLVVWGEQYRNYFLEFALPSLLAPGNIPAITGVRPSKFLIATTAADWDAMHETAVFRELERHVAPVFLELPPHPPDRHYWYQAILGHKLCCEIVVRDRAVRIFTAPDTVYSDGMVAHLHQLALDGAEAVLKLVAPLTRTDLFVKSLAETGLLPENSARDTGRPLVLAPRQLVKVAFSALHGASRVTEWEAPYFFGYAATPWWRVSGGRGMVIDGNFWDVALIDYSVVKHDSSLLDVRGWDGDYLMRTIGNLETIYFVRDSDEFHVVSWASFADPTLRRHRGGEFIKAAAFRISAYSTAFNAFQRDTLFMPTFVHAGELSKEWNAVEQEALRTLATLLDPPRDIERYSRRLPPHRRNFAGLQAKIDACALPWWRENPFTWGIILYVVIPIVRLWIRTREFFKNASHARRRIMLALRGDTVSIERLRWHGRRFLARAKGRPFS